MFERPLEMLPCAGGADESALGLGGSEVGEAGVYEAAVDERNGQLFVLLDDGQLQVWDATSQTLRCADQVGIFNWRPHANPSPPHPRPSSPHPRWTST